MTKKATYECHLHEHGLNWFALTDSNKEEGLIHRHLAVKDATTYLSLEKRSYQFTSTIHEVEALLANCQAYHRITPENHKKTKHLFWIQTLKISSL